MAYVLSALILLCRDPVIRRRALSLLRRAPMQEGVWSSQAAWRVSRRIVELEEAGLGVVVRSCGDVPEHARIEATSAVVDGEERRATVEYWRQGRRWKEVLTW